MAAATSSAPATLISETTTEAPSAASFSHRARPIPDSPPVTSATRLSSLRVVAVNRQPSKKCTDSLWHRFILPHQRGTGKRVEHPSISERLRRADVCGGGEQRQHAEFGNDRFPAAAEADKLVQRIHRPTGRDAMSDNLQRRRNNFPRPPAAAERRRDRSEARRVWVCRAGTVVGLWWRRPDECKRRKRIVAWSEDGRLGRSAPARKWRSTIKCPNGASASSPTLRQRSYVGLHIEPIKQPQRGCGQGRERDAETKWPQHRWDW